MSVMPLNLLLNRITHATPASPIAVLQGEPNPRGRLNAVFAATVESQRLIRDRDPDLIGVWHAGNYQPAVRDLLLARGRESRARFALAQGAVDEQA